MAKRKTTKRTNLVEKLMNLLVHAAANEEAARAARFELEMLILREMLAGA
jgi:hypothetical protein